MKIIENPLILAYIAYPGCLAAACSAGARGAREAAGSERGGATGVPEAGNMLGMLPQLSLPICGTFGGLQSVFLGFFEKLHFFKKMTISIEILQVDLRI